MCRKYPRIQRPVQLRASQALAATPASYPCHGDTLTVLPVQHPAQISDYGRMSATPALLAAGMVVAAVAARSRWRWVPR